MIGRARSGVSGVTVVRGDAGLGKSTLLGIAARAAQDLIVVRCRGIESEQSMPYAGLHLLCSTVRTDLTELSGPQAAAMAKAFGRAEGDADPFLVGLATVSVLTAAARHRPALWLIDDAQWLDDQSAAALAFVLRRLDGSPVSAVVSTRSTGDDQFAEFPDLHLTGLTDTDARSLLRTASFGRIDDIVLERIVAESRGNPRTLLHVAAEVTSATFAAGYGLAPNPILSPERLRALTARMAGLDPDQRLLLVLAAADSTGDPALLWRASEILGIDRRLASAAENQGLLRLGTHVLFPEPAERTAVYRSATAGERADVHRALADATGTPDRRTWHLACASAEPNDALALELELQAAGVGSRLGQAGAAAFLERSALLTSEGQLRAERALAAADARFEAGSAADCAQMLITAALGQLDEPGRAHLDHHRARLAFSARRNGPAAEQLLQTAQALHQLDEPSAGEGFLEALVAATHAGRLGPGVDVVANKLPGDRVVDGLVGHLLEGLTARFASGFRDGCRVLTPRRSAPPTPSRRTAAGVGCAPGSRRTSGTTPAGSGCPRRRSGAHARQARSCVCRTP